MREIISRVGFGYLDSVAFDVISLCKIYISSLYKIMVVFLSNIICISDKVLLRDNKESLSKVQR